MLGDACMSMGIKPVTSWPNQTKGKMASNQITQIKDETGSLSSDPETIYDTFRNFTSSYI